MAIGTQKTCTLRVNQWNPGDIVSGRTMANLGANGGFAKGDLTVGLGCFVVTPATPVDGTGVQYSISVLSGVPFFGGIVSRNFGGSQIAWDNIKDGYSMTVQDGYPVSPVINGDVQVDIAGVTDIVVDHVPTIGEYIFVNTTTGKLVSAISKDDIAGYLLTDFTVSATSLRITSTYVLAANHAACVASSK